MKAGGKSRKSGGVSKKLISRLQMEINGKGKKSCGSKKDDGQLKGLLNTTGTKKD